MEFLFQKVVQEEYTIQSQRKHMYYTHIIQSHRKQMDYTHIVHSYICISLTKLQDTSTSHSIPSCTQVLTRVQLLLAPCTEDFFSGYSGSRCCKIFLDLILSYKSNCLFQCFSNFKISRSPLISDSVHMEPNRPVGVHLGPFVHCQLHTCMGQFRPP